MKTFKLDNTTMALIIILLMILALSSCTASMVTNPKIGDVWSRECYKKSSAPELVTVFSIHKKSHTIIFDLNKKTDSLSMREFKNNYTRYQLSDAGYPSCRYCSN